MARQYSAKSFLRQAPNYLLQRHLTELGVGEEVPWKHLGARDTDLLHREIERAPDAVRRQIDRDFREMYGMAAEHMKHIATHLREGIPGRRARGQWA